MASLTIENYIKAIYQICSRNAKPVATTGELASVLAVQPSSVTNMLKTLSEAGLAVYTPYEGVSLTEAGRLLAMRVLRRHRLLELFLVRTLQLSWDEVHDEAEELEHAVSDYLIDRIDAFLGHPEQDPHGDPIPKPDGTISYPHGSPLADWSPSSTFTLVRVLDQSPEFLRYLSGLGLQPGVKGRVEAKAEPAGVMIVSIDGQETALALEAARKLMVTSDASDQFLGLQRRPGRGIMAPQPPNFPHHTMKGLHHDPSTHDTAFLCAMDSDRDGCRFFCQPRTSSCVQFSE